MPACTTPKHRIAHGLRTSLLPHALPAVPGLEVAARYLPGTRDMDIGGDFYDLVRIDGTTLGAVIGDVQGHNVTAAALMGQDRPAEELADALAGSALRSAVRSDDIALLILCPGA